MRVIYKMSAPSKAPISIARVVYYAHVFNSQNWAKQAYADKLPDSVTRLFDLLRYRNIDYLLVGGMAMLQYVPGRNTPDIDLIIAETALERFPELYIPDWSSDFVRANLDHLPVDLWLTNNALYDKVQKQYATSHTFAEGIIPCA